MDFYLFLHYGYQDIQWRQHHSTWWDVPLIRGWARLVDRQKSRLLNRQGYHILLSNLWSVVRSLRALICILQGILSVTMPTMFSTPRERLSKQTSKCQGYRACLLFVFQRSSERVKGGVVKVNKRLKEVFDEV